MGQGSLLYKKRKGMVAHTCNTITWEFKTTLVYIKRENEEKEDEEEEEEKEEEEKEGKEREEEEGGRDGKREGGREGQGRQNKCPVESPKSGVWRSELT